MYSYYETDRLILKTLGKEAAPMVLSFYEENKDHLEPWEPIRSFNFYSLYFQKASLTAETHLMAEGKLIRYWVSLKDNPDEIIGTICFLNFLRSPYNSCTIGYKFGKKYCHKGYAFESISKSIEIFWNKYNLHRIEAYIMETNQPSIGLIKRLKFDYEGICYSYAYIGGQWRDHNRYSIINPADKLYSPI